MTAEDAVLRRDDQDGIATLTMNRPAAHNALSRALINALFDALVAIAADTAVRVVIIAGNGASFCAGHDLRELRADPSEAAQRAVFTDCARLMIAITRLQKPVIARVHGHAIAAGCQLIATCDLAIAAQSAAFSTPGVAIGLFGSTPMVALTRAVGRKVAMEMLLTGEAIGAAEALRIGLVNRVVPEATLAETTLALARTIAGRSRLTLAMGKEAFYRQADMSLEDAYGFGAEVMTRNMMSQDAAEGIDAFLNKRDPVWRDR